MLFVDLVAGAVGLLDFQLEQFRSTGEVELSGQWHQRPTVGKDVMEVIGAVGTQFNGFLKALSDSVASMNIHQHEDAANMTQGMKFPLPQSAEIGFGLGTQSARKRASKAASPARLRSAKSWLT